MTKQHIPGLDSIRFICALLVVFWHLYNNRTFSYLLPEINTNLFSSPLNALYTLISSHGQQGVVVFFVLSGFCIHFPYANGENPKITQFYIRRYIRVGVPCALILFINLAATIGEQQLWSVDAELIYYTLYPFLMRWQRSWGWQKVLITCFLASYLIIAFDFVRQPQIVDYGTHGVLLNWLVGLPCWLAGCFLAERWRKFPKYSSKSIWLWRAFIFVSSYAITVLSFQFNIGFNWTLNLFVFAVVFWLSQEITYSLTHKPWKILEWAGRWSYSLYLCHLLLIITILTIFKPNFNFFIVVGIYLAIIFCVSYIYYLLVEKPALKLASMLSKNLANQPKLKMQKLG